MSNAATIDGQTIAPAGTWKTDPAHTRFGFAVKHNIPMGEHAWITVVSPVAPPGNVTLTLAGHWTWVVPCWGSSRSRMNANTSIGIDSSLPVASTDTPSTPTFVPFGARTVTAPGVIFTEHSGVLQVTQFWSALPNSTVGAAFALMQLKTIFCVLLRDWELTPAQPPETYRNDHSKMVVQLAQPCQVHYRRRVRAAAGVA